METNEPNYTETKAKSPGNPGNFLLGKNKEGEYKGEMENMVKPSTLNQRCCSKSNEQEMNDYNNNIDKICSIIKFIFTTIFLTTLIIWAIIEKNYELLWIIGASSVLAIIVVIFFIAYKKAITGE